MNNNRQLDDEYDLIIGLRNGDHEAYSTLYKKYRPLLSGFLRKMQIDDGTIQEIFQASFQKLWESRHNLSTDRSIQAYLFQIAKHMIYNEVRKNALREKYIASLSAGHLKVIPDQQGELQELINDIVEKLSP